MGWKSPPESFIIKQVVPLRIDAMLQLQTPEWSMWYDVSFTLCSILLSSFEVFVVSEI